MVMPPIYRLILIAVLGTATAVGAQPLAPQTPEAYVARSGNSARIVPANEMTIDGKAVACKRVPTVLDPDLYDFAMSFPGFIVLRPDVMRTVSTAVALWIYYHECGHVSGIKDEVGADCFSVRRGKSDGWLTPRALEEVCLFIGKAKADGEHPGGSARCAAMRQCFIKPEAKR
jgi:hypothetical protein